MITEASSGTMLAAVFSQRKMRISYNDIFMRKRRLLEVSGVGGGGERRGKG